MRNLLPALIIGFACSCSCLAAEKYVRHNLVSDLPGMADRTDPCLINPWGIAASPTSPFWVSDNGSGLSTLYDGNGVAASLTVSIPGAATAQPRDQQCGTTAFGAGAPTGVVFNDTTSFLLGASRATFIFSTEQGVIAGWNGAAGKAGVVMADRSAAGAIYKGLATATRSEGPLLYAADFANGRVDIFNGNMTLLSLPGAFTDPAVPAGFAPFNIQNLGGSLYVAYAKQDSAHRDDDAGPGNGYVDVFDLNGLLLQRLIAGGPLNSPWGLALAPASFGDLGGALLVGNFGDGSIHAFDPVTGRFLGALLDGSGATIRVSGLWGLAFGNGTASTDASTLYFTAGIAGPDTVESHGLLGTIQRGPEIQTNGVVTAGSFSPAIAPGAFAAIFGNGLAATTRAWAPADFVNGKLPVQLDGVSVTINGTAAYVYYVSPAEVVAIVPAGVAAGPVPVVLTNNGLASPATTAQVQVVAPALFASGKYAIATHADGSLVAPSKPAAQGETIVIYGTGFGPAATPVDGVLVSSAVTLAALPTVTIGNTATTVSYAGLTQPGLDQINVAVPPVPVASTNSTDVPISASAGESSSQTGLFIAVRP